MNIPNVITIIRMLMVPLTVWLIISEEYLWAFFAFIGAGVSDGIDGFIARRFHLKSHLGAILDPLADKLLLVSIYVTLGFQHILPAWLVILIVSRDVLIVGGVVLHMLLGTPMEMRPLLISKVNTAAQIMLAGAYLLARGLDKPMAFAFSAGTAAVALLTIASGALYLREWVRHMAGGNNGGPAQ